MCHGRLCAAGTEGPCCDPGAESRCGSALSLDGFSVLQLWFRRRGRCPHRAPRAAPSDAPRVAPTAPAPWAALCRVLLTLRALHSPAPSLESPPGPSARRSFSGPPNQKPDRRKQGPRVLALLQLSSPELCRCSPSFSQAHTTPQHTLPCLPVPAPANAGLMLTTGRWGMLLATQHRPCSPEFCGQRLRSPEWPKSTTACRFPCCWLSQMPVVPTGVSPHFAVCPLGCTPAAPPTSSLFSTQQPKSPLQRLSDCALLLQLCFGSPHRNSQCPHHDHRGTQASPPCPRAHPAQLCQLFRGSTLKPGCAHPGLGAGWSLCPGCSCPPAPPQAPAALLPGSGHASLIPCHFLSTVLITVLLICCVTLPGERWSHKSRDLSLVHPHIPRASSVWHTAP